MKTMVQENGWVRFDEEGQALMGRVYLGKKDWHDGKGEQTTASLKLPDGHVVGLPAHANLLRQLERVGHGRVVLVTYKGQEVKETRFGPKDCHVYEVGYDLTKEEIAARMQPTLAAVKGLLQAPERVDDGEAVDGSIVDDGAPF